MSFGTCDKLCSLFWNRLGKQLFSEFAQARSLNFPFSINGCFSIFGPIKRSSTYEIKISFSTDIWTRRGYQEWLCLVAVTSKIWVCSIWTLLNTLPIRLKGRKACPCCYFNDLWNASLAEWDQFSINITRKLVGDSRCKKIYALCSP